MENKRISTRMRTLKAGKIAFGQGGASIDCILRNVSNHGACLEVESPLGIPAKFDLKIGTDSRPCSVMWRSERKIGVAFD
jgi:PilZ domain